MRRFEYRAGALALGTGLYAVGAALAAVALPWQQPDPLRYEFRASTFTESAQDEAAVAINDRDETTVVWSSRRQQEGRYGVYAQRFDANGVAIGAETQVNLWAQSHQMSPDVASGGPNTWFVWQSHKQDGNAGSILLRRFDAAFEGGSEILVNENWRGHQADPIVAAGPQGQALVVWTSATSSREPQTVQARLFHADGAPATPEFRVLPGDAYGTHTPAAAFAADGSFMLAFAVTDAANRPAGIRMQRYDASGNPSGALIDATGVYRASQIEPVIAAAADGYVVAWLDAESDGDDYGVVVRRFAADGTPRGPAFLACQTTTGPQNAAALAVDRDGSFVVAWNSSDGDESGVFARRFAADGTPAGDEFLLTAATGGRQAMRIAVATNRLAIGSDGRIVCAWNGDAHCGDKSAANLTLHTRAPLNVARAAQGVTAAMTPATTPILALADGPGPHIPPTFDPADVGPDDREIRNERGSFGFTAVTSTGWTPPDPHMAVGPNHIVVMTNGRIAAFTKDGTQTFADEIEDSFGFWGGQGATGFVFDPEVLYDELSGRFFAMAAEAFAPGNRSYVLIAVSDDSDPNGTWFKYRLETTSLAGDLFDSPNIGVDAQAVYVTGDGFGLGSNYPIFIYDKASMLVGNPPAITRSLTLATSTQSAGIPPVSYDNPPALYMMEHAEASNSTTVRLIALRNPLTTPTINTFTLSVASYGPPEDPPQQGTSARPESFDARFWSVAYRNGSLWGAHHVNSSRVRARWYEVAMNGWPTSGSNPSLVQSGEIDPGGSIRTSFCSIGVDADGDAAMTFTYSSPNDRLNMGTAYRLACDPLGTFRAIQIEQSSTSTETSGRWGDYSAVQPDPADANVFWAHHEYRTSGWRTWVAKITTESCQIDGDLDHDGDVDLTDLSILLSNFGLGSGQTYEDGDIDGDGDVDLEDLSILLANYGT